MAGSFNRVILVGNLVRDPEIRYIASGTPVTKFTMAVNRRVKGQDEADFIDVVAWDKLAETCNTYLKKGSPCLVEGRLSIRSYEDKEGIKRKAAEVVINTMQMLSSRGAGGGGGDFADNGGAPIGSRAEVEKEALDDEIPF